MNQIVPFKFDDQDVRIIDRDGNPWFVATDVARVLGYAEPHKAISRHCRGGTFHPVVHESHGEREAVIIPEGDVYRLIIKSKLPAAQRFEVWVMEEVLPTIRKSGSYGPDPLQVLNDPAAMRGLLLTYSEKVLSLEAKIDSLAPKARALDLIATGSVGSMCITDAAKSLQRTPKFLFDWLQANGWIYRRPGTSHWIAYQAKLKTLELEHKVIHVKTEGGNDRVTEQVRVTAKGLATLSSVLSPL